MKNVLLVALLIVSVSCGKKKSSSENLAEREVDPYTGQVNLLRASIAAEVFINEADRTITILESKTSTPPGDGRFTCPLNVRAGARWNYNVVSDGRTLMLVRNYRETESFSRMETNFSVLGTWTEVQYINGMTIKTIISFPHARSMTILQECNRKYY